MVEKLDFDKLRNEAEKEFEDEELEIELEEDEDDSSAQQEEPSSEEHDQDDDAGDTGDDDSDDDAEDDGEDEEQYKGRAAKRIQQLLEERKRLRQEAEELRRAQQTLQQESEQWRTESESSKLQSAKTLQSNLEDRVKSLQREWERAYEEGDGKALGKVNSELQNANIQLTGLKNYIRQAETRMPKRETTEEKAEDGGTQASRRTPQPTPAEPDQHAKRWANKNKDWFGRDRVMTTAAFAIHEELIQDEGYNPADESDQEFGTKGYYRELDRRLRQEFPQKFEGKEAAKGGQRVMGATRGKTNTTNKSGKKVVKLTKSERDMADRLGISHQAYAKRKYELEHRKGNS